MPLSVADGDGNVKLQPFRALSWVFRAGRGAATAVPHGSTEEYALGRLPEQPFTVALRDTIKGDVGYL
jgi:hypothetical protein